jgi:hypothetical protein
LYLNGSSAQIVIPANRSWYVVAYVIGRQTATAGGGTVGDTGGYTVKAVIKRDGANNTALSWSTVVEDWEDNASWTVAVARDDTNEAFQILVTGIANATIHWNARVELVEVG